jgi:hypothetical protein
VLAATLAIFMGLGWWATFGSLQSSKKAQEESRANAQEVSQRLNALIRDFTSRPGHSVKRSDVLQPVQLTPELGVGAGGMAMEYFSRQRDDWVLVYVGGLDAKAGPYGATIQSPDGRVLVVGRALPDTSGGVALFNQFPQSLKPFTRVVVTDGRGHVVLTGTVAPDGASTRPTSVG